MRKIYLTLLLLASLAACSNDTEGGGRGFTSNSYVYVDPTLQSNMVLQQNAAFRITGKGTPDEKIRVSCSWENEDGAHEVTVGSDGRWSVSVQTPAATKTPQSIHIRGRADNPFVNILIGEVWLCTGQSNMQWFLKNALNGAAELAACANENIRVLDMDRTTADKPADAFSAQWKPCTPTTMGEFSGVGYFFGRKLQQELDVPIGLVAANEGNTAIEVWMERTSVESDPELYENAMIRNTPHDDGSPHAIASCYNARIYPLRNLPVAGAVWYQGENNQGFPVIYEKFLKTMIAGWRADRGCDFPFYIAQIAPCKRLWDFETNYSNPAMRFAQARTAESVPGCAFEVNDDIADPEEIHPVNKQDVGLRLAYLALGNTYDKRGFTAMRSPFYAGYRVTGSKFTVVFNYAEQGLTTSDGGAPTLFEICGEDRVFHPATAVIAGSSVELTAAEVPAPVAARLGWSYTRVTNLRGGNGLPVSVFRTYDWEDPTEEKFQ